MTTVVLDLLGRLRDEFDVEVVPGPDGPRMVRDVGPPPLEAEPLIEELRRHRAEVAELLASGRAVWREDWERARLESTPRWADEEWPEGARTWAEAHAPELQQAVEAAMRAIDRATLSRDVTGHLEACSELRLAVADVARAFRDAHDLPAPEPEDDALPWGQADALATDDTGRVYRIDVGTGDRIKVDEEGTDVERAR